MNGTDTFDEQNEKMEADLGLSGKRKKKGRSLVLSSQGSRNWTYSSQNKGAEEEQQQRQGQGIYSRYCEIYNFQALNTYMYQSLFQW